MESEIIAQLLGASTTTLLAVAVLLFVWRLPESLKGWLAIGEVRRDTRDKELLIAQLQATSIANSNGALTVANEALIGASDTMRDLLREAREEAKKTEKLISQNSSQIAQLRRDLQDKSEELAETRGELTATKEQLQRVTERLEKTDKENEQLLEEKQALEDRVKALTEEKTRLEGEVQRLTKEVDGLKTPPEAANGKPSAPEAVPPEKKEDG